MGFFGSEPQTGNTFTPTSSTGGGFFGTTPVSNSNPVFQPAPQTAAPQFGIAPETGNTNFVQEREQGNSPFGNFIFDFGNVTDAFSWLGNFSLTAEGDTPPIPVDGALDTLGLLQSTGVSVTEIETFLGLTPNTLNTLTGYTPTNGAVLKLSLTDLNWLERLDEVEFNWNFTTGEGSVLSYDDFSFFATSDGQVGVLGRSIDVGSFGSTGWQSDSLNLDVDDDEAFIAFGVVNVEDTAVNSYIGVDEVELVGVPADQGPTMGTAFFGF